MFIFIFCRGGVPICAELQSKSWRWTLFRCWCYVESCGKNFGWMVARQVQENKISSNVSSTAKHLWAVPFCPHRSRVGTNLAVFSVSVFSECWEICSLPNKPSICRSLSHLDCLCQSGMVGLTVAKNPAVIVRRHAGSINMIVNETIPGCKKVEHS